VTWGLRILIVLAAVIASAERVSLFGGEAGEEVLGLSVHVGAPTGIGCLRPQTWGLVEFNVVNTTDRGADVLATMFFAGDPNLQYCRQVWAPAGAKRRSWCAVFPPPFPPLPPNRIFIGKAAELESVYFDRSGPAEVRILRGSELRPDSRLVSIDQSPATTAVIAEARAEADGDPRAVAAEEIAFSTVSAAKLTAGQTPLVLEWCNDLLPPVVESLAGLDLLVLYNDRLAGDAAALVAVRQWLFGGGRLWVMLDSVDPATVELLLGDGFQLHVVDHVGLTEVLVEEAGPEEELYKSGPREFEEPVELVRVLVSDVEVAHTVNGWPASFWQPAGRGEVLFTTLGPRGWVRPRTRDDPEPPRPLSAPPIAPTPPLANLGARLFQPREPPIVEREALEPYLSEQIGYRIVSRGSIGGILGAFCMVLLVGGAWLARRERLDRMVWLGPTAAVVAASVLALVGFVSRKTVLPTVAVAQVVEVEPGAEDIGMTGLMAMYNQETSDASLGVRRGGVFHPDMTGLGGTARRVVRTDLDAWHWERLALPNGVRTAPFEYATRTDRGIEARAAFGPRGLAGEFNGGPFEELADTIIAAPSRINLAVALDAQGGFVAGADDVLATGEFVVATLLSDEQHRRQLVYERLLRRDPANEFPARPTLLAWARPLDMQFTFPSEVKRVGSAMLAVPLVIERTPPATRVVIPSPFLPFRSIRGSLAQISSAYGNRRREWIELTIPTQALLRFQLPETVLPVALDRATLTIRGNVPSRELGVFGFSGDELVRVATRNSPIGTFAFDVDRADVLGLDDRGGLRLGIEVGSQTSDGPTPTWKIEDVQLDVTGATLESGD